MPKDKKNKSVKNELKSALNSNVQYEDDDIGDLPYAFTKDDDSTEQEEVVSFTNITVSATDIDDDDDADKHIQVTYGEAIENLIQEKIEPKETSKETQVAKKMLKKNNGTAVSRMIKDKPTKKQRQTVVFGIVLSILILIGAFTTISTISSITKNFINSTSLKTELIDVVFPMVIVDIPEFETPTNLDSSVIISTAIWSFITDTTKDMSKYQQDDLGSMYVPDVDIEIYVRKLYGSGIEINHQTINDSNIQIIYNEQEKLYIIESNPSYLPYSPRIEEVKRTGSIYTLTVSYILPTVSWSLSSYDIESQEADKIMEYTLIKSGDNYHFSSVKLLAINDHNISRNEETEYMGNNSYSNDDSEIIPDMQLDEQIASDIMAEEAKKLEGTDEEDEDNDVTDEDEDEVTDDESNDDNDDDESDESDEDEE